jgi:hypothetical protein
MQYRGPSPKCGCLCLPQHAGMPFKAISIHYEIDQLCSHLPVQRRTFIASSAPRNDAKSEDSMSMMTGNTPQKV